MSVLPSAAGPGMSLSHSTKPLLLRLLTSCRAPQTREGGKPCFSFNISCSPTGARHFGHRSFHLPSYSAELPLAPGCLSHLVEQVNHLSQLGETTQHWHQVNPGAGEQSTAGSSGLVLCLLRGLGTRDVGAGSSSEPLHKHQLC